MSSEIGRRFFLKIVSATGAAAACSPSHAPEKLVPLLNPPENMVPGKPLFYRTVCRACMAGCGVTARAREGRVVKLEGNPEDPISGGALCARGQAELQTLYAPGRLRGPLVRKGSALVAASWTDALAQLGEALGKLRGGPGLRLLSRCEPGTAGAAQKAFAAKLGARRVVYEPRDLYALRAVNAQLFGSPELPVLNLSRARSVVSFGADFLETWLSPVEQARAFMGARSGPGRPLLTWVGPRLSMSGANADSWLRARPGDEARVAIELLRWIVDPANKVAGLQPESAAIRAALPRPDPPEGISPAQIASLGRELSSRGPSALLPGEGDPALAAAVQLLNCVLGNIGKTVLLGLGSDEDAPSPIEETQALIEEARRGEVKALFIHRADPLGQYPVSARVEEALRRIPLIVAFGERLDATARLADFVLPDHHALEAFGDLEPRKGVRQLQQPALAPLWDTRLSSQVMLDLAGSGDFRELSKTRTGSTRETQERGTIVTQVAPAVRALRMDAIPALLRTAPGVAGLQLFSFATPLANADPDAPGWLREIPDALTGVSWSSWAELSEAAAASLGVKAGDLLSLHTKDGQAELPAVVNAALHDGALAVPRDAPELRALGSGAVQVARSGKAFSLPLTGRASQEGRPLARTTHDQEHDHDHPHEKSGTLAPPHEHKKHRWAMAIDLDKCTGCQACVVACYAENNIPVVGPQAARDGRMMAWLRIQRSFETGKAPDQTRIAVLPSLCQQCDSAPCETVCPVYATYHTAEGLNAQVYNRCIGTRYCANNCPYDARVFNWSDHVFEEPLQMQLNPDVSARTKGVMEKCTFCVQRIRAGEYAARDDGREVRDGEIQPACVQTCPAQALTFGDAKDPSSRVVAGQKDGRAYRLLEEVNTLPAIAYLSRRTGEDR
jgi:Fe-S-cluster-containing dehydrogenase component/anaerobic selenocysteine-containing dehydrogenase